MSSLRDGRWRPSPFLRASILLHAAAAGLLATAPRRWRGVLAVLAADHAILTAAGLLPRSRLLGPNLRHLPGATGRTLALSFDDGPDPRATPGVLDLLDEHAARASFFCVGRRVAAYPELAAEIARRGHHLENHTFDHSHRFAFFGPRRLEQEIVRAQETIGAATGRRPRLFRPPAGLRNPLLEPVLARHGLRLVSWTRRGLDGLDRDPRRVLRRLEDAIAPGAILMLHDAAAPHRSPRAGPAALPLLLERIAARGFDVVPIAPDER